MTRELTGRHVLAIALGAFAIIIGANMTMLFSATGSFPGLVVKNSYVASQKWDANARAQQALGWKTEVAYEDRRLSIHVAGPDGKPIPDLKVTALVGRPTTDAEDRVLVLTASDNRYSAPVELAPGAWRIEIGSETVAAYVQAARLFVPEAR